MARPINMVTVIFPEASGYGDAFHRALHGQALADAGTKSAMPIPKPAAITA